MLNGITYLLLYHPIYPFQWKLQTTCNYCGLRIFSTWCWGACVEGVAATLSTFRCIQCAPFRLPLNSKCVFLTTNGCVYAHNSQRVAVNSNYQCHSRNIHVNPQEIYTHTDTLRARALLMIRIYHLNILLPKCSIISFFQYFQFFHLRTRMVAVSCVSEHNVLMIVQIENQSARHPPLNTLNRVTMAMRFVQKLKTLQQKLCINVRLS